MSLRRELCNRDRHCFPLVNLHLFIRLLCLPLPLLRLVVVLARQGGALTQTTHRAHSTHFRYRFFVDRLTHCFLFLIDREDINEPQHVLVFCSSYDQHCIYPSMSVPNKSLDKNKRYAGVKANDFVNKTRTNETNRSAGTSIELTTPPPTLLFFSLSLQCVLKDGPI